MLLNGFGFLRDWLTIMRSWFMFKYYCSVVEVFLVLQVACQRRLDSLTEGDKLVP